MWKSFLKSPRWQCSQAFTSFTLYLFLMSCLIKLICQQYVSPSIHLIVYWFQKMKLADYSSSPPKHVEKDATEDLTKIYAKEIARYQEMLYAQSEQSILIVLQGMDAAGKSSTIRDVFQYVNPMGIHTKSFKKPTKVEFAHDFLWRVHQHAPQKGMISIFDRSHYEDILIQRVHNWITEERVQQRMKHINNFEELLVEENNTTILKFYLHISKDEQEDELMERKEEPDKFWKHNDADWEERKHWDDYMKAYEDIFNQCSPSIPWTIVPANKGWYKRFVVAKTLLETMKSMDLRFPGKGEL